MPPSHPAQPPGQPGRIHHKPPHPSYRTPNGWRSRGYIPHFDRPGTVQTITYRLADSIPQRLVDPPTARLAFVNEAERRQWLETTLDRGYGACHLRNEIVAEVVERAFCHFDGERYRLLAWVLMPNHVHIVLETMAGHSLSEIVQSWKSFTAKEANRLLGRAGTLWHPEYFDRAIRDERHFSRAVEYVEGNPVNAGLVVRAEEWRFGSAWRGRAGEVRDGGTAGGTPAVPGGDLSRQRELTTQGGDGPSQGGWKGVKA